LAKIVFTAHLREVAPQEAIDADGATIGAALDTIWLRYPRLRGYVVDEQGALRKHIAIFLDGKLLKSPLRARIRRESHIHIMQALSGG
jgi:molybdopterin synthase sulfur carrier subunit